VSGKVSTRYAGYDRAALSGRR